MLVDFFMPNKNFGFYLFLLLRFILYLRSLVTQVSGNKEALMEAGQGDILVLPAKGHCR